VKYDAGGAGASPQGEIRALTGATNAGVFTTGAFGAAVAVGDIVQIVHPLLAATISLSTAAAKIWKQVNGVDVNITAILASETDVLNLPAAANTTYMLNHLRLKSADPGLNTVLVRLYEEVNGALTVVDTKNVDSTNFADYFSLMDLFSLAQSVGNNIKVTVQTSAGGPYPVTANYSYATATV
jgi:hypothetical protein